MATPATATQQFVPVKEIRSGVVVLKDGGYRGVLICSSINFGLKSADEQRAITLGFQNFLNTQVTQGLGNLVVSLLSLLLAIGFCRYLYKRKIFLRL